MKVRKRNFFFIVTGLQVINAVEYIYSMQKENEYNILFVCNKENTVRKEVISTLNIFNWDKVIYLPPAFILKINFTIPKYILNLLYSYIRINIVNFKGADLIGNNITIYYRYVTKKRNTGKIIFIDDGNGSINFEEKNPYRDLKDIKNKLWYNFLGIKNHLIQYDIFFTSYPDEVKKNIGKNVLIKNNFSHIKASKIRNETKNVYFIGDPHVERGYISKEKYIKILINCKEYFGNRLVYVPRIFEDKNKLDEISKYVIVKKNDVPFELFVNNSEEFPKALVAYHSTVLFNVNKMFGNMIEYYFIKLPDFTNEVHMNSLERIWKNLKEFAIEIEPLQE